MPGFAAQRDLFVEPRAKAQDASVPPLDELVVVLDHLSRASSPPWPDAAAAMAEEQRVLRLATLAGPSGKRLADAILVETERLLTLADAGT